MAWYEILAIVLLGVILLWFFLAAPGISKKRRNLLKKYDGVKFAHRGLWGNLGDGSVPERIEDRGDYAAENSLSAFRRAAAAGYGIELDTRLSKDGVVVVFHDDTLERVTGDPRRVEELTAKELSELPLSATGEGVPTFAEVLAAVNGRVPLLVEIKEEGLDHAVTDKTAELLRGYRGDYIVESFDPFSLWRFRKLCPDVPTGLLFDHYLKEKKFRKFKYFLVEGMLFNFLARPDFLALEKSVSRHPSVLLARICRPMKFAWTVRSAEEAEKAKNDKFQGIIFEKYRPIDK